MVDKALVNSYVQGQVGRRAFIRKLVRSGVSLAAAVAYAKTLGADPARASHGEPDNYNEDVLVRVKHPGPDAEIGINPGVARVVRGGLVQWDFLDGSLGMSKFNRRYEFTDAINFIDLSDGGMPLNFGHRKFRFFCAGTFHYSIAAYKRTPAAGLYDGNEYFGKIQSLVRVSKAKVKKGESVFVSWATKAAPEGWLYDVQIKRPGDTSWSAWKTGVVVRNAELAPGKKGFYRFRARIRRSDFMEHSGYSPIRSLEVV